MATLQSFVDTYLHQKHPRSTEKEIELFPTLLFALEQGKHDGTVPANSSLSILDRYAEQPPPPFATAECAESSECTRTGLKSLVIIHKMKGSVQHCYSASLPVYF